MNVMVCANSLHSINMYIIKPEIGVTIQNYLIKLSHRSFEENKVITSIKVAVTILLWSSHVMLETIIDCLRKCPLPTFSSK